ncbi:uncharacterized protein LOC144756143 isoform X5 [Lissotriton helveticus]
MQRKWSVKQTNSGTLEAQGSQDDPKGVDPGRSLPVPKSAADSICISKPAALQHSNSATAPSGSNHQRRPPGLDEEILCVLTQPMFASGLRVLKLIEVIRHQRGIDLENLSWKLGYQDVLDLLEQVPNSKLRDPSKGVECVIQFQPGAPDGPTGVHPGQSLSVSTSAPDTTCISKLASPQQRTSATAPSGIIHQRLPPGLDEEILSVLTRPMFAGGIRVLKLIEVLMHQRGIDLENLSWELGYHDVFDLLQQVPNSKLRGPSKGVDCVIQFQPGHANISDATNSYEEKCWFEDTFPDSFLPSSSPASQHKPTPEILDTGQPQRSTTPRTQLHQASTTTEMHNTSAQPAASMSPEGRHSGSQDGPKGVLPGQILPLSASAPDSTFISKPAVLPQRNSATALSGANHQRRPPGSVRKRGPLLPNPVGQSPIYPSNHWLRTELPNTPYSSTSHAFLYPVPHQFPQKQNQYRTNNEFKHFPSTAPWFPSQKTTNAAVYFSKNHQKPGPPQQSHKPGMTLVFRASKPPASAEVIQSGPPTKSPAVQYAFNKPSKETTTPIQLMASASSEDHCTVKDLDPILKDEILVVLLQQPRGVYFGEFAGLFHRTHGYQLKLCHHGFTSLRSLLDEMIDLVDVSEDPFDPVIKCKGQHHYVFIGGGPFSSQI